MNFSKIQAESIKYKRLSNNQIQIELYGIGFFQNLNKFSVNLLKYIQRILFYDYFFKVSHLLRFCEIYFRNNLIKHKYSADKTFKKKLMTH